MTNEISRKELNDLRALKAKFEEMKVLWININRMHKVAKEALGSKKNKAYRIQARETKKKFDEFLS